MRLVAGDLEVFEFEIINVGHLALDVDLWETIRLAGDLMYRLLLLWL